MQQEEFVKVPYHNTSLEPPKWNFVDQMDKSLPFLSCLCASLQLCASVAPSIKSASGLDFELYCDLRLQSGALHCTTVSR